MPDVALRSLTIYSNDLEKTRAFYEAMGFELHKISGEWANADRYYYTSNLEGSLTFKISLWEEGRLFDNGLVFWVDSVPETLKRLSAIQIEIVGPHNALQHLDIYRAIVLDPDGRRVTLWNKNNPIYQFGS